MEGLLRSRQPSSAGSLNESAARHARRLLLGGLVCELFVDLADLYRDKFKSARDAGLRGSIGIERRAGVRRLERFMCHGR